MTLNLLTKDALRDVATAHYGSDALTSSEVLAEAARAELFALGHTLRWVLAQRVVALLAPFDASPEAVFEVLQTLESTGDLSAGPGGEVACAPLRAVPTGPGRWLLAGTLPSHALRVRLEVPVAGLPRRISAPDEGAVRSAVRDLGGSLVPLERWAGLDRSPAVTGWLVELGARLDAAGRFADRAGTLAWNDLEVYSPGPRWKRVALGADPVLVRARQAGGWTAYAWARMDGGALGLVPLGGDEARRTMFAVDAAAGAALRFEAARGGEGGGVEIGLPVLLPAAEYRWLAAAGEMRSGPRRVWLPEGAAEGARAMLGERLGVGVERAP